MLLGPRHAYRGSNLTHFSGLGMTKEEAIKQAITSSSMKHENISGINRPFSYMATELDINKLAKFLSKFVKASAEEILEAM